MDQNYEIFEKQKEFRKTWSIAFFNATNSAIEMVKALGVSNPDTLKEDLASWRNWFLSEHSKYYSENIAVAGGIDAVSPKVREGLDKIRKAHEKNKI